MKSSKISILCQIKLSILFLIIIFTIYCIYHKYWKKNDQITEHFKDDNYVKTNEKPHLESCQDVKIKTEPGCEEVNRQNIIQRFKQRNKKI